MEKESKHLQRIKKLKNFLLQGVKQQGELGFHGNTCFVPKMKSNF
jgi:hypothetical protein